MALHKIRKGLRLPIVGEPEQRVDEAMATARVALVAADYHGLRPTMHVQAGDQVKRGQLLSPCPVRRAAWCASRSRFVRSVPAESSL